MKSEIKYLELKSGYQDNGPAWIGLVNLSKSGKTVYFNGRALKSLGGTGISGNYFDIQTNEEFWISDVKKNGFDRHWAGSGIIHVDERIVDEYLQIRGYSKLDPKQYTIVSVQETDVEYFNSLENQTLNS